MTPNYVGETRWKDIYDCLKAAGIDVYSPGQHDGVCVSPYAVVRFAGSLGFYKNYSRKAPSQVDVLLTLLVLSLAVEIFTRLIV